MRARQRHFQLKSAGVGLALDSRYLTESDGSTLQTWSDRSGNSRDASQSDASFRPTVKTGANGIGGNPVLLFDGTNDRMTASQVPFTDLTFFSVMTANSINANGRALVGLGGLNNQNGYFHVVYRNNLPNNLRAFTSRNGDTANFSIRYPTSSFAADTPCLLSFQWQSATISLRLGGTAQSNGSDVNAASPGGPDSGAKGVDIGTYFNRTDFFWSGNVGLVAIFPAFVEAPLLKRLEHAAAYSFKISCN
jgi:hypothetical protein